MEKINEYLTGHQQASTNVQTNRIEMAKFQELTRKSGKAYYLAHSYWITIKNKETANSNQNNSSKLQNTKL